MGMGSKHLCRARAPQTLRHRQPDVCLAPKKGERQSVPQPCTSVQNVKIPLCIDAYSGMKHSRQRDGRILQMGVQVSHFGRFFCLPGSFLTLFCANQETLRKYDRPNGQLMFVAESQNVRSSNRQHGRGHAASCRMVPSTCCSL